MFSKAEASQWRQNFWTAFGHYMTPVPSAEGEKVSWVNYKTGEKDLYFRMQVDAKEASVSIDIAHKDLGIQQLYFEQFLALKKILHEHLREEWKWELHITLEGRTVSRIHTELSNVSLYRKEDWPLVISFFKQRIMALDAFWSEARYAFESLH